MKASFKADYAELDCLSSFSFLRGASHPAQLVQRAASLGYQALALCDECSLAGVVRAHIEAKDLETKGVRIKLIIGSRFNIDGMHLIVLACNKKGYGDLSELITLARRRSTKGSYSLSLDDIARPPPDHAHLRGLPDCLVILRPAYNEDAATLCVQLQRLQSIFPGRLWLGLALHHRHADANHRATLMRAGERAGIRIVALGQVEMHLRSLQPLHHVLTAVRLKQTVSQCGYALQSNAERYLRSRFRLAMMYPVDALRETLAISERCVFRLNDIRYSYPREIVPDGMTPEAYLRRETFAGAMRRYPSGLSAKLKKQLEDELDLIVKLEYEPYFLTVYEIVNFARSRNILCQGRGSAANSAVCYCLHITEVDPNDSNVLFARFISLERKEPPDIDVDFEHQRREEVIQHIYGHYGRDRAALTAVVSTYRIRSVLRDTGKALGLDSDMVDRVTKSFHYRDGSQSLQQRLAEEGLDPDGHIIHMWASLARSLSEFPRHLSQHPGGFVIADEKLCRLVPIENAAMPNRSVVQWNKDDLDAMGMLKVDVLALGMLSALHRCLDMVALRRGQPFRIQDIQRNDAATFAMIQRADTVGVFQIESRAQMSMLPRLRPREFYDLVIQVAIVRPGPIQGGMVQPYLEERDRLREEEAKGKSGATSTQADEKPSEAQARMRLVPALDKILKRTLGVPIFQEQAMQIAMDVAGFSADEADALRRSMAAWQRPGKVQDFRNQLIQGLAAAGCEDGFAEGLYSQLQGFADYGFPESHAASFAHLTYISAWLKRHEPAAFLAALLNSQPMGFYQPAQLVQDARRHGVQVLPVDVMVSDSDCTLEWPACKANTPICADGHEGVHTPPSPAVRLGLNCIKSLSKETALRIEQARRQQAFSGVHDLALRAGLNRHALDALAAANALQTLAGHRRQARWQAASPMLAGLLRAAPIQDGNQPVLPIPTEAQEINADYQTLRLTLGRHPLALLREQLQRRRFMTAEILNRDYPDRRLARACGIVTARQRPGTAKGVVFVTLEDETGHVNVIVHEHLAARQRRELATSRLMGVYGIWQSRHGTPNLVATRLTDLTPLLRDLPTRSRDFH
ncbi:error-prone DNA polymerase [Allopusillimonas soli]|uniref:Error-prone DNA polymerase n=1 Tax=Allopusillimonas soli TaxID=659016 RepID=A0A853FA25_9BURK|nr:error-prone DNA polymerase [Allopusillimonas soli]NYT36827.1 error-prone DNA polymerase [Allopusillimonas soli]TEA75289.1 error-prone DNA polymerase [Allopusillimonas soli]